MDGAGVDALVVSHDCDIEYFTDFIGHDSWLLVTPDQGWVISDTRYDEQLNPVREAGLFGVVMGTRHRLHVTLADLVESHGVQRLGIQAEHLTVNTRRVIAENAPAVDVIDTAGVVGGLRMTKDAFEIAAIEHAIEINEQALRAALPQLTDGMTEREFSAILEHEMKRRGGSGAGFTPIIAAGPHGSLPHYQTSDSPISAGGSLLVDWGTTAGGYQSDLTRTFGLNKNARSDRNNLRDRARSATCSN